MLTKRENYLIAARGGKPEWVPIFPEDVNMVKPKFWDVIDPETGRDFLGIRWIRNDAGKHPDERYRAMERIADWRKKVVLPELSQLDWETMSREYWESADPDKVNIAQLNTAGIFLIPINMVGWEEGLCAIYEEPEELEAFVTALTDFLVELVGYLCKYFKPDIIFTGDDVAATGGPLISQETWVSLYKPRFKRIIDEIHAHGVLAEFHCCGNCQHFIEEFLEIGSDICQLPMPNESLRRDKERFGSRLVLTGGWDRASAASMPNASEEVVRESAHIAIDT